jgi:hypothetical protein
LVCTRDTATNKLYCVLHDAASNNLINGFERWKTAIGNISWERYLETILKLKETGESSKEVAKSLLDKLQM